MHQSRMCFDVTHCVTLLLVVHLRVVDDVRTENTCFPVQDVDVS